MDYATFMKQVDRGEAPALILLHGGDVQLLDDALDAATRALFPDRALAAWGREVFDARESTADEIVRAASTLPLGVDRRLVAVRRAQVLAAKGADALVGYAKTSRFAPRASAAPITGCSRPCRPRRSSSSRRAALAILRDGSASVRRSKA